MKIIRYILILFYLLYRNLYSMNFFSRNNKINQIIIFNKLNKRINLTTNTYNSFNNSNLENIKTKKIIKIAPDGIHGFYDFGINVFIKLNYNLDNYIFSGVSSGSWNALFLTFNKDINKLVKNVLDNDVKDIKSLIKIQENLKKKILNNYSDDDFDLDKLYICVIQFENLRFKKIIYTNFNNLEDAVNCCIASSNIPFITGKLFYKYNNKFSFDGIFLKNPYLNLNNTCIYINKNMMSNVTGNNINLLFQQGLNDSKIFKHILDDHFK